jgi:hypothetical protein
MLRIDKRLYLTIPIYEGDESVFDATTGETKPGKITAWVHSAPIAEELVDQHFMVLGRTYSTIFSQGLGLSAGPANAMRVLRHTADLMGVRHNNPKTGAVGVEEGLIAEMMRLANVVVLDAAGQWQPMPLEVAVQQDKISPDDKREVENAIAFFIAACATLGRSYRKAMVEAAADLWGAQITSSAFTEFTSSLRTSTGTDNSGEKSPAPVSNTDASANAMVGGKPQSVPV